MDSTIPLVMLVISIVTPGQERNVTHQVPMPTVEICLQEAERFLAMELPEFIQADAISANCVKRRVKEEHS